MTRNTAREIAMHLAYELSFTDRAPEELVNERLTKETFETLSAEDELYAAAPEKDQAEYIRGVVAGVAEHAPELDGYIEKYAKNWEFSRISRVAAAILRIAMYEILYQPEVPYKVAANEAVELAKTYEGRDIAGFVNGILAAFIENEHHE